MDSHIKVLGILHIALASLGILGALIAVPIAAAVQLILTEVVFPRQDTE